MTKNNSFRTDINSDGLTRPLQSQPSARRVIRPCELGEVETCLESVVIPGELESWVAALQQACVNEGPALRREITQSHPQQLAKLSATNANLAPQVAQMQEEDIQILKSYDEFEGTVQRLHERAETAGAREDRVDERLQTVVEEGLALVIRVRKQERALSTWLSESVQRDNGVGD